MTDPKNPPARTGEFALNQARLKVPADFSQAPTTDADQIRIPVNPEYYPDPTSFRAELKKARQAFSLFRERTRQMLNDVRVGKSLHTEPVQQPLVDVVASVIRHPDPMVWMTRLIVPQSFLGGHMIRTAILSAVLGRGMGLAERQLERLAWGGLLSQIGKARLPRQLLEKPGPLAQEELEKIRSYVGLSLTLCENTSHLDIDTLEIIRCHHERYDGSGYPAGLDSDQIPVLARLVGIVDWYDTMTSRKPYTDRVISSTQAVDNLNRSRNGLFHDQVVEEFVRAIGLYPNGALVELDSGEIGVVQAQNVRNRTQPRLVLVLDEQQQPISPQLTLDLLTYNQGSKDHPKTIRRALPDGEFGLNPAEIIERGSEDQGWLQRLKNLGRS